MGEWTPGSTAPGRRSVDGSAAGARPRTSTRSGSPGTGRVAARRGRRVVRGNDYLGLSAHPAVVAAAAAALERWGAGAGASRLVTGSRPVHSELEAALAAWLGEEAALLFPTGYAANLGALATLGHAGARILSDARNHASIVDGCRLARADVAVYRHADIEHVAWLLAADPRPAIVVPTRLLMTGRCARDEWSLCDRGAPGWRRGPTPSRPHTTSTAWPICGQGPSKCPGILPGSAGRAPRSNSLSPGPSVDLRGRVAPALAAAALAPSTCCFVGGRRPRGGSSLTCSGSPRPPSPIVPVCGGGGAGAGGVETVARTGLLCRPSRRPGRPAPPPAGDRFRPPHLLSCLLLLARCRR